MGELGLNWDGRRGEKFPRSSSGALGDLRIILVIFSVESNSFNEMTAVMFHLDHQLSFDGSNKFYCWCSFWFSVTQQYVIIIHHSTAHFLQENVKKKMFLVIPAKCFLVDHHFY